MKKVILPTNRGVDVRIYINDIEVGGQKNAQLNQTTNVIDITNKITGEWETSIAGVRAWALICSGMEIKGAPAYEALQNAFNNGSLVTVKIIDENIIYSGNAIISSFPLVMNFNDAYLYNITFKGVGQLNQ